jgi:hypothetical protein
LIYKFDHPNTSPGEGRPGVWLAPGFLFSIMEKIPVTFKYEGQEIKATLDTISGAGGGWWHLMVEGHYWGRLRRVGDSWAFDSSKFDLSHMVDHFAAIVIAWYQ